MPLVLGTQLSATHSFIKHAQESINLLQGFGVEGDVHAGKKTQHEYYIKVDSRKGELRDNIRHVHLVQSELFSERDFRHDDGTSVLPGQMGENITTVGVDLLALGKGTKLRFVDDSDDGSREESAPLAIQSQPLQRIVHFLCFAAFGVAAAKAEWVWCYIAAAVSLGSFIVRFACHKPGPVVELTGRRKPCKKIDEKVGKGLYAKVIVKDESGKTIGHRAGVMGIITSGGVVKPGMKIMMEQPKVFESLPPI